MLAFNIENFRQLQQEVEELHKLINLLTARLLVQKEIEDAEKRTASLSGASGAKGSPSGAKGRALRAA